MTYEEFLKTKKIESAGNSLNLPCAADVIGRIVKFVENEGKC